MRTGYTHIAVVLDESGSMSDLKQSTIDSFNKFVKEQSEMEGEATISLVKFNNLVHAQYHFQRLDAPMVKLNAENYRPGGTTALYDAEGWTIEYTGKRLAEMTEDARPEKVIVVIITDGLENASTDFTREKIEATIKHQEEVYKWQVIFLGANHSATASAQSMGISMASAMTYASSPRGVESAYEAMSENLLNYRAGLTKSASFTPDQRSLQSVLGAVDDDLNGTRTNELPLAAPNRNNSGRKGWPTDRQSTK